MRFKADKICILAVLISICAVFRFLFFPNTVKFVDTLIFIAIVFFFASIIEQGLDEGTQKILSIGGIFVALLLIFNMNDASAYTQQNRLAYNFVNSNTAGTVALNIIAVLILQREKVKKIFFRGLLLVLELGTLYVIWLTASRACFAAAIIMEVFSLLIKRGTVKGGHFSKGTFIPVLSIPVMFVLFERLFKADIEVLGKPLFSGRETLWSEAMEIVWNNLIHFENEFTSGLNVALRLPYLCGIIGAVLFFILLYTGTNRLEGRAIEAGNKFALLTVVLYQALLFQQSFESTMISGSYCTAFIMIAVLGCAFNRKTWEESK